MKIGLCTYKINSKEEGDLIAKIGDVIDKRLEKDKTTIYDLAVREKEDLDVCLCFGAGTKVHLPEFKRIFVVHSLKEMIINPSLKKETLSKIEELITYVNFESTKEVSVETQNVTFGATNAQVLITEEEANHLLKLKELLGDFDRIVITKGDLKVVLEGKKNE